MVVFVVFYDDFANGVLEKIFKFEHRAKEWVETMNRGLQNGGPYYYKEWVIE